MCLCTVCGEDGAGQYPTGPLRGNLLCHSCLELRNLEAQIADIDLKSSHIEDDYFNHRFPPEIASHIFVFAISGPETPENEHLSPLTLGAVSRRWREIAWSTPRLWTRVPVNLKAFFHRPKELLLQWIARSGELPLSIHIFYDVSESGSAQHAASFADIFGTINELALRWETLSLRIPFSLYPRLHSKCDEVPLLKRVIIQPPWFIEDYVFDYSGEILDVCAVPPLPWTVMIRESPFTSICINWSNVTTLQFSQISVIDCLRLFQQAPQMTQCSLDITHSERVRRLDSTITVPHLTKLNIRFLTNEVTAGTFLDSITLPALKHLEYHESINYTALSALFTRSSCSLASLNIRNWQDLMPSTQSLLQVLRASPSLGDLRISMTQLPKDFFDSLSGPSSVDVSNQVVLLPMLRSFYYRGKLTFDWTSFINCLDSRQHIQGEDGRPLLRSIDLSLWTIQRDLYLPLYYIDEPTAAHICRLVEHGIDVRIMNGAEDMLQYSRKFHEESGFGLQAQSLIKASTG
ncbi:hypothetical protein NLJ89_g7232 [Agrocybe chaxingu]|uniref:F-box domain-containing protein n=1 Tax=Agrocybe chaxingu TaxID=84603 RepID=A0A9W8JXQ9_9AGAR|nr:hypothetical protein NLJ89_g7232 [Agrocybe chaxingu]